MASSPVSFTRSRHPWQQCFPASIAAVIGLLAVGCGGSKSAKTPPPPPEVLVLAAPTQNVPVFREWVGTLDGSENAEIRARVSGNLLKRNYKEGGLVKKGDILFEIDERPSIAALEEAKSQLEQAKASQIASQAEADRSKELFGQKVISEKEFTNKMQRNESDLAKIKALEAGVEQARLSLTFCKVEAPVEGIAGIAQAQVGDLVGSGLNSVLTTISTLDPIKVLFPISEVEYLAANEKIQEAMGKPFEERVDSIELVLADGKTFANKARLLSVDRQVNAATGTILVTALVSNPGSVLRPGLFARARVMARTLEGAVVVPQRAVMEIQGSFQIALVGADGKAEIRPVKVGPRTGSEWVISEGLKAGEVVVVEGIQKVRAGVPVSAKPWTPTAPAEPAK